MPEIQVPDPRLVVVAAGDGLLAVRGEAEAADTVGVAVEAAQLPAGAHVPQDHLVVVAAAEGLLAAGEKVTAQTWPRLASRVRMGLPPSRSHRRMVGRCRRSGPACRRATGRRRPRPRCARQDNLPPLWMVSMASMISSARRRISGSGLSAACAQPEQGSQPLLDEGFLGLLALLKLVVAQLPDQPADLVGRRLLRAAGSARPPRAGSAGTRTRAQQPGTADAALRIRGEASSGGKHRGPPGEPSKGLCFIVPNHRLRCNQQRKMQR